MQLTLFLSYSFNFLFLEMSGLHAKTSEFTLRKVSNEVSIWQVGADVGHPIRSALGDDVSRRLDPVRPVVLKSEVQVI